MQAALLFSEVCKVLVVNVSKSQKLSLALRVALHTKESQ